MSDWLEALRALGDTPAVLVTVVRVRGSAPRPAGTKLVVTADAVAGSIGGGNLEYQAIRQAREQLGSNRLQLQDYPLGPALGQCCGGHVSLLFEPLTPRPEWPAWIDDTPGMLITDEAGRKTWVTAETATGPAGATLVARARERLDATAAELAGGDEGFTLFEPLRPPDFQIALFGAGHVGRALVRVLAPLPCRIRWIDDRAGEFPDALAANIERILSEDPPEEVDDLPAGGYVLAMTHSHALDEAICERVLRRGDQRYLGLIGSRSKRARFEQRWRRAGLDAARIGELTCPIGLPGIDGRTPAEIAVAVAAQLLLIRSGAEVTSTPIRAADA
ncbi:MAG: xanthine dehydrogenase accessory protein XdhC [Candidatus Competibacterales bacterium]|nr:xanthine dehydrogenase accessory protein XdhC [Candidatus Competibacterales bacterium]